MSCMAVVVCMTISPRIPTTPGWSTSGLTDQADSSCTKREAKREVSDVSHEG